MDRETNVQFKADSEEVGDVTQSLMRKLLLPQSDEFFSPPPLPLHPLAWRRRRASLREYYTVKSFMRMPL